MANKNMMIMKGHTGSIRNPNALWQTLNAPNSHSQALTGIQSQQHLSLPNGLAFTQAAAHSQATFDHHAGKGSKSRRRPGTASRKAALNFNKKLGLAMNHAYYSNSNALVQVKKSSKSTAQLTLDVSKLRPRIVTQERERLYDDVMKQKMTTNNLADENMRLRTKVQIVQQELQKKERVIDDLVTTQKESTYIGIASPKPSYTTRMSMPGKTIETHLVINLKRKIRDLQTELAQKDEEIEALKKNIKFTRASEMEVEVKMYMDECVRIRQQLEEVIMSKDTFADPEELKMIEEKFSQKDKVI